MTGGERFRGLLKPQDLDRNSVLDIIILPSVVTSELINALTADRMPTGKIQRVLFAIFEYG